MAHSRSTNTCELTADARSDIFEYGERRQSECLRLNVNRFDSDSVLIFRFCTQRTEAAE